RASSTSRAGGISSSAPTATIAPSFTATLAANTASGVTTRPPRMTRSTSFIFVSQHRPTAVDRQVDAGDLARRVARQEQTGVGDVHVGRDALERVIGGMARGRLFDRDGEAARHLGAHLLAEAWAVDHAGRHAVDVDVVRPGFEREALGDAAQAPFRRGIRHAPGASAHAEGAAHVDDLAVALR